MSREKILWSFPQGESEPYGHPPINRVYEAMDEYAKDVAIGFVEWATGRNLEISLGVFVDNEGTYDSINEYFNLYIKSINK